MKIFRVLMIFFLIYQILINLDYFLPANEKELIGEYYFKHKNNTYILILKSNNNLVIYFNKKRYNALWNISRVGNATYLSTSFDKENNIITFGKCKYNIFTFSYKIEAIIPFECHGEEEFCFFIRKM